MMDMNLGFEEVDIGNATIAEFIGLRKNAKGLYGFPEIGRDYTDLFFHSSFEWLMPVLTKIEEFGYDSVILRRRVDNKTVYSCKIRKENDDKAEFEANVIGEHRTTVIWRAVLLFISKHGELKKEVTLKTT